jgi:hypothetical protein
VTPGSCQRRGAAREWLVSTACALLVGADASGCAGDQAHASPRVVAPADAASEANVPGPKGDQAAKDAAAEPARKDAEPSDATLGHLGDDAAATDPDALEGLTRAQVRARRGPPTRMLGQSWIYTPDQPGCREMIVSEVVTFKGEIVVSVRLDRARTHKICADYR